VNVNALLFDIGNSYLKWGLHGKDGIYQTEAVSLESINRMGFDILAKKLPDQLDVCCASNVAGKATAEKLKKFVNKHYDIDINFVSSEKFGHGVTNGYQQPKRLGVDRWVAMIAAWSEIKSSLLIVDFGTALTLDAIDNKGVHLGGQIIPGLETMFNSLVTATSDINTSKLDFEYSVVSENFFGKTTIEAIRGGSQNALIGALEGAVLSMQKDSLEPVIVITGGGAKDIPKNFFGKNTLFRPNLILDGLVNILKVLNEKNLKNQSHVPMSG
tara:strand:- start:2452 stop:3264 length:813 start_codon:yes stop_codon:yes gene_type:complete